MNARGRLARLEQLAQDRAAACAAGVRVWTLEGAAYFERDTGEQLAAPDFLGESRPAVLSELPGGKWIAGVDVRAAL